MPEIDGNAPVCRNAYFYSPVFQVEEDHPQEHARGHRKRKTGLQLWIIKRKESMLGMRLQNVVSIEPYMKLETPRLQIVVLELREQVRI